MLSSQSLATDFPLIGERAYLNTAAEGLPPARAKTALLQYWDDKSQGMDGREPMQVEFEACRLSAARLFGLAGDEISFCSCASEAFNLLASTLELSAGDEIIVSDLDFPSGATPWLLARPQPHMRLWENVDGELHFEDLVPLLSERTRLVQISLISFLTGYRVDWPTLSHLVREYAPNAVLSVDVTQAAGRVVLDCMDADCIIASSYKWMLGVHGSCVVGVPKKSAQRLTTRAGGWFHLIDGFGADRFKQAEVQAGAKGFSVGMPAYPSIYALRAGIDAILENSVESIAAHADPLVRRVHDGLLELGILPMSPLLPEANRNTGIVAFLHSQDAELQAALEQENIHVMRQAGRVRVAVHGYNRSEDIHRLLSVLERFRLS